MRHVLLAVMLGLAACEHSRPFSEGVSAQPPRTSYLPRRLTFNTGDDRHPQVAAGRLVFSRLEPDAPNGGERCLAYMPPEGGTLETEPCPPLVPQTPADTFLDTWTEPALSPDGARVAFMWQQGSSVGVLGFYRVYVVVAPAEAPNAASRFTWQVLMTLPGGRYGDSVRKIAWVNDHRLRFLICHEYIFKVKGGGQRRYTDTAFISYGLAELDLQTGIAALVPLGDSVLVWAPAPDGGSWVAYQFDPSRVYHLSTAGDTTPVAVFSDSIVDLAPLGGGPVALLAFRPGQLGRIQWVDTAGGEPQSMFVGVWAGPARHVAAVPGSRRLVVEIERGDTATFKTADNRTLYGAPANLWLYDVP